MINTEEVIKKAKQAIKICSDIDTARAYASDITNGKATLAVTDYSGSSLPLDECFGKDVTKEVKNIINFSVDNKMQARIEKMKPKEIFADAVATSTTSILIGDLAKLIKQNGVDMGQKRLFLWLRENGYLIKRNGSDYNMPTQKSMEMNLFEVKESTVNNPDGSVRINRTTKVTGKGQQYFINKFLA